MTEVATSHTARPTLRPTALEVADLVRRVLQEARLAIVDVPLVEYDGLTQVGDDAKDFQEVITAFQRFVPKRLEEARRANPGKTVRLNLKIG